MGFYSQEYLSELPFPPPEDLPDTESKPRSLASPALAGGLFTTEPPGDPRLLLTGLQSAFSFSLL